MPPAVGPLQEVLGFARRPFAPVEPLAGPYQAEPHASTRTRLLRGLEAPDTALVALVGQRGTGRSTILRGIAAELGASRLVILVDLRDGQDGRTLPQRLGGTAGAGAGELTGFLARLEEERRRRRPRPLLVLDGVQVPHPSSTGLSAVLGEAASSGAFQVLLCGEPGVVDAMARAGADLRGRRPAEVTLPALDPDQVAHYVRAWLRATRPEGAPPLVFSQDALLLLALRSQGVLQRIDRLASNMLVLAAAERRRTVTSWHAWAASDREPWYGPRLPEGLPARPPAWPPAEAIRALDLCRQAAGLPPWPRSQT
jgi:type II secretory pathway predicted ATPase ExeA